MIRIILTIVKNIVSRKLIPVNAFDIHISNVLQFGVLAQFRGVHDQFVPLPIHGVKFTRRSSHVVAVPREEVALVLIVPAQDAAKIFVVVDVHAEDAVDPNGSIFLEVN